MFEDIIKPKEETEYKYPFIHGMIQPEDGSEIVIGTLKLTGAKLEPTEFFRDETEMKSLHFEGEKISETKPEDKIIDLTDLIKPPKVEIAFTAAELATRAENIRLMDVLGFLNHVLRCHQHDPITPKEMTQELWACINHINTDYGRRIEK